MPTPGSKPVTSITFRQLEQTAVTVLSATEFSAIGSSIGENCHTSVQIAIMVIITEFWCVSRACLQNGTRLRGGSILDCTEASRRKKGRLATWSEARVA